MYLNLLREERSYAKRIVRLSNPYSKGKKVKINSSTYLHIQERLNREGFKGTVVDLEFEKKLLIDEYQRHFFG
jgi:hypothetical protein